jgi:hypothetical protein
LLPIALPDYYLIAAPFPGHWKDYPFAKSKFQSALFWIGQRRFCRIVSIKKRKMHFSFFGFFLKR